MMKDREEQQEFCWVGDLWGSFSNYEFFLLLLMCIYMYVCVCVYVFFFFFQPLMGQKCLPYFTCFYVHPWHLSCYLYMQYAAFFFFNLFGCVVAQLQHTNSQLQHVGSKFLTSNQTQAPYLESTGSWPLVYQGSPHMHFLKALFQENFISLNSN